jgi:hypothetical protein
MESMGNDDYRDGNGVNVGNTVVASTLHLGPDPAHNRFSQWGK